MSVEGNILGFVWWSETSKSGKCSSNLTAKVQRSCIVVTGRLGFAGRSGCVLFGMVACVEQEGEELESVSFSVMKKA